MDYQKRFNYIFFSFGFATESDQVVPTFLDRFLQYHNNVEIKKTLCLYLPPINLKLTEFEITARYMEHFQSLPEKINMLYANIILNVEITMNVYQMTQNHPLRFKNLISLLGDSVVMKENFDVSLKRAHIITKLTFLF